jgi:DNA-binding CsgD family transcriptional regulator
LAGRKGRDAVRVQGPASLIGRDDDLDHLRVFVDRAALGGGALLLSGDAGVGKTVLLDATAEYARAAGCTVLRAVGAEFERAVGFAGLHQVLRPLLGRLADLEPTFRAALDVALGRRTGTPPSHLVVSNAVLSVLGRAGGEGPVLVVVDDLPWLDRASAQVLGLVARRLAGSRVGLVAARRTGEEGYFDRGGLPEREIGPLDDAAAEALVADRFPAMASAVRRRLVADARGNPLALLELPVALSRSQRSGTGQLPDQLPLSRRLQAVFEARVGSLPARTRYLLLAAGLDATGSLGAVRAAAAGQAGMADLAPAERARLVVIDAAAARLSFCHPLTRSAAVALSTSEERRSVHGLLAEHYAHDPERNAWHRARAAVGPDERVAELLDHAAARARGRGDVVGAVAALLRAAELSPPGAGRSRRLAGAAHLGSVATGELRTVPALLEDARAADDHDSLTLAVAAAHHLLLSGEGDVDTAHRLLVGAIEMQAAPYDATDDSMVEALNTLGWVCYFGGRAELWEAFHRATGRLAPDVPLALGLVGSTFADPARTALPALRLLDAALADLDRQLDPIRAARVSLACIFVDRLTRCRARLWRMREDRDGHAVTLHLHALSLLGLDHFMTGEWDEADRLATEHVRLSGERDHRLLECLGLYLRAMVAAGRGDDATVIAVTDRMVRWAAPRGVLLVQRIAAQARTLAALGRGDFEPAYRHASMVSPAGELASHVPHALWLIMDMAEAATRTGRHGEAAAHVAAARRAGVSAISPRYTLLIGGAEAMATADDEAFALFDAALAVPGVERWPFDVARVRLAYGERLRRAHLTTHSRVQLTVALETFDRLGARPWAVRAGQELRASGMTTVRGAATAGTGSILLTPQQREIVRLAATGLTNKQIGAQLFLSPRTVATHLYQAFPKLGVATRAGLSDALRQIDDGGTAAIPVTRRNRAGRPPS